MANNQIFRRTRQLAKRSLGPLLVAIVAASFCPALSAATVILVRHAERVSAMSADALLSPAGEERARELARVLKDAKIQRIYVTEVRRTQQTAAPLAAVLHITPTVIAQKDTDALVKQLRDTREDETVLVVGHTNTLPLIIDRLAGDRLGGGPVAPIADTEYDRLIVLFLGTGGKAQSVTLRYGNASK